MDFVSSDVAILDLLRKSNGQSISQLSECMQVTPTAVRQRLTRLMAQGHVERRAERAGRGRPSHRYYLTDQGRRKTGANFADLAMALWEEIREIKDPEVRRGLLSRVAKRLAESYSNQIEGETLEERMDSIQRLFEERRIPFAVEKSGQLPVLTALACPYPELAEQDRGICSMEKMLISELAGQSLRLTQCRLDGETSCCFESAAVETIDTSQVDQNQTLQESDPRVTSD